MPGPRIPFSIQNDLRRTNGIVSLPNGLVVARPLFSSCPAAAERSYRHSFEAHGKVTTEVTPHQPVSHPEDPPVTDSNPLLPNLPVITGAFPPSHETRGSARSSAALLTGVLRDGWYFEAFDHGEAIDPFWWRTLLPATWKDRRYHQTLEETFADNFAQFYLLLRDETGRPRVLQPLFLVVQDVTVSLPGFSQALVRPVRRWLSLRLLMVGCIVGEGLIGVPDLAEVPETLAPLQEAIALFARHQRVGITLFKDFPAFYRSALNSLKSYVRLPSLPAVRLALDFSSFEEYVQSRLGPSTRKSLRRKFREVDSLAEPIRLEVKTSVTLPEARVLHALYERVARRGDRHFEVFNAEYFLRLGERMPDQARYFIWKRNDVVVAFSFCTVYEDTIYDHDLGMDLADARPLHLYHVTFRDIVRWALAHGLKHYQSSPFNYAPKLHLRMELLPLDLYVRHTSPLVNRLLGWVAPFLAPTRQEPSLPLFPNAREL